MPPWRQRHYCCRILKVIRPIDRICGQLLTQGITDVERSRWKRYRKWLSLDGYALLRADFRPPEFLGQLLGPSLLVDDVDTVADADGGEDNEGLPVHQHAVAVCKLPDSHGAVWLIGGQSD